MSKVTIKFWDVIDEFYLFGDVADYFGFYVDQNGFVFDYMSEEVDHLEPHFYKDGERIA